MPALKETNMRDFIRPIRPVFLVLLLALVAGLPVAGQQAGSGATAQPPATAPEGGAPPAPGRGRGGRGPLPPLGPATEPRPRDDARHQSFLEVAKAGQIDLLFVGDSITDWWRNEQRGGLAVWNQFFAPLRAANFGIAGDTTQGVLWRMQNGELDGFQAKLIVLMLGTNNINRNPNAEIADGNRAIVNEFRKRQPNAKVGVFPRGRESDSPFRAAIKEINDRLKTIADDKQVFFLDIGDKFLAPDGTLTAEVFPDGLHPNELGYRIWANAILGRVKTLLAQ
jgi:lysophospholipase L1-like esterase